MATDLLGLANQKLASHKSESCIDLSLFGKALGVGQMDSQVDITFQVALACDSVQPGCNIMQRAEWKPVIIIEVCGDFSDIVSHVFCQANDLPLCASYKLDHGYGAR